MKKNRSAELWDIGEFLRSFENEGLWVIDAKKLVEMSVNVIMTYEENRGSFTIDQCVAEQCEKKAHKPIERLTYIDDIHWHTYQMYTQCLEVTVNYLNELFDSSSVVNKVRQRFRFERWIGTTLVVSYDL